MKKVILYIVVILILNFFVAAAIYAAEYEIRRLTDQQGIYPEINYNGQVVWQSNDGIYYYDGSIVRNIHHYGTLPKINNAGQIVWDIYDRFDPGHIYLFDGNDVTVFHSGIEPSINGQGDIVWEEDFSIMLYRSDMKNIVILSESSNYYDMNELGYVAWREGNSFKIYNRQNIETIYISDDNDESITHIQINDRNNIVYSLYKQGGVYLYDSQTKTIDELSPTGESPYINNNNKVIWVEGDGRLFMNDGTRTLHIADNPWLWQIADNDDVIWWEYNGGLYVYKLGNTTMISENGGYFDINSNGQIVWTPKSLGVYLATPIDIHNTNLNESSDTDEPNIANNDKDDTICFISIVL